MTIAQQIGRVAANIETATRSGELATIALFLLQRGGVKHAASYLHHKSSREGNLGPKLFEIVKVGSEGIGIGYFKSAVTPITSSALADYSGISTGFINGLTSDGAYDFMLPFMARVPLGTGTVGAVTVNATAYSVSEGSMKPITRLSIANTLMNPQKAIGAVVISQELARSAVPGTVQLIERNLRAAVGVTTDGTFFNAVLSGVVAATSTGSTAEAVRADISNMLKLITTGAASKLFIITTPLCCKMWSMLTDSKGISAFPDLGPQGGMINKIPVLVTDGLSAGQVVLMDASGIAGAPGDVSLQDFSSGSVQLDTAPDSPVSGSTNILSLWQSNLTGIAVERWFVGIKLRSDAVALTSNSNSYQSGNSPA